MLNCEYCNYLKKMKHLEKLESCKDFLCEYSNSIISLDNIYEFTDYPCCNVKK